MRAALAALVLTCGIATAQQPSPLAGPRKLIAAGNFPAAEVNLRTYLVTAPASAPAHYLLAYALLRQNKPQNALQEYTRAATFEPPTADELRNVAQAYVLLNDLPDAGKWMTRAVEMNRSDPESWYSLGRLRYTEQRYLDALDCFKRALALAPGSVKVENNLGLAYEGLNRPDDAIAAYRQAMALQDAAPSAPLSEQPLLNLAVALIHRGEVAEAKPLLLRAVAIAPADPHIQEQLGQMCLQQGNFADAAKYLEAAVRLDPEKSNLHFLLGQAYRHLGRQQQARAEFEAVARLTHAPANARD